MVAELNGQHVRVAMLEGEFPWHHHEAEDELFLVHSGRLVLRLRDREVTLRPGELFVIPRGVEHSPFAPVLTEVLIFEPASHVRCELTVESPPRVAGGLAVRGAAARRRGAEGLAPPAPPPPAGATPRGDGVSLVEITAETVRRVLRLAVKPSQTGFVAPNAVSVSQAHFEPKAWVRAVHARGEPVGFVMLSLDTVKQEYYLWRFMIDATHQGRGHGKAALLQVVDHVRTLPGATALLTSVVEGAGGPRGFYESLGFVPMGAVEDGETVLSLAL